MTECDSPFASVRAGAASDADGQHLEVGALWVRLCGGYSSAGRHAGETGGVASSVQSVPAYHTCAPLLRFYMLAEACAGRIAAASHSIRSASCGPQNAEQPISIGEDLTASTR